MRKLVWSACMITVCMVGSSVVTGTFATPNVQPALSVLDEQRAMDEMTVSIVPVDSKLDVRPLVLSLAGVPGFADWREAGVEAVRNLNNRDGERNAVLWNVQAGGTSLGYLVTTPDGQAVYEFSHRPVPELPANVHAIPNGYLYGGPSLQLAYVQGEQGPQLFNLLTGEELPNGELLNRVPDTIPALEKGEVSAQVHPLPATVSGDDDAVYATGLYGKMKLGDQRTGVIPLQEFAKKQAVANPTQLVYDAIPDKLYVTLNLQQILDLTPTTTFLAVTDPFALSDEQRQPIYIHSDFPVAAVPVQKTPTAMP
ncbi:hypothetical protein JJB07_10195 [Tumebacillus sp. ITR2]|uniref:Copper amine oxidase-like N-terminal domain-containing protein n=1 Tax=Tumebacillus amylolyticus TaxID=2801339 RepID=A0ABS1JA15_9BACL|nr:hypothetical protein [Tumebacillus amylolyticus]MBL0387020.1 hypothetical protein [Tumebacillus amylolyticus]